MGVMSTPLPVQRNWLAKKIRPAGFAIIIPVKTRIEKDSMGELEIPADAYYGVQTQRAVINFPISGWKTHREQILATVHIKKAAALANLTLKQIDVVKAKAIIKACDEMLSGKYRDQVVVDVFQSGAGTSYHMNINEILANRGLEIMGHARGDYKKLSTNDDDNFGQSTNDVIPTTMRLMVLLNSRHFLPTLEKLRDAFGKKAKEFDKVIKAGRTHLQDAVPVRLGQEFRAYATIMDMHIVRYKRVLEDFKALGIGGTAVGTGLNAHPKARFLIAGHLSKALKMTAVQQHHQPHRGGNHIIRRLAEIYIIVQAQLFVIPSRMAHNFKAAIGENFIDIHVVGGAGAGLKDIHHLVPVFPESISSQALIIALALTTSICFKVRLARAAAFLM